MQIAIDQLRNAPTAYNYAIAVAADVSGFRLTKGAKPKLLSCRTGRWLWLKREIDFIWDAAWLTAVLEKEQISVSFDQAEQEWKATCPPNQYAGFPSETTASFACYKWAVIGSLLNRLGGNIDLPDHVYAVYQAEIAAYDERQKRYDGEEGDGPTWAEMRDMGAFDGIGVREMNGSEKQAKWAVSIIKEAQSSIEIAGESAPRYKAACSALSQLLGELTDSAWIIQNRRGLGLKASRAYGALDSTISIMSVAGHQLMREEHWRNPSLRRGRSTVSNLTAESVKAMFIQAQREELIERERARSEATVSVLTTAVPGR